MKYKWSESITLYEEAVRYHDFYRKLAGRLRTYIEPGWTVCDIGCGGGYLSLELAGFVPDVLAVDIDPEALEVLREAVNAQGLSNIRIRLADFCTAEPEPCDVAVLCQCGDIETEFDILRRWGKRRMIWVMRASAQANFSAEDKNRHPVYDYRGVLDARGLGYRAEEIVLPFGQPFKTFDDALAFLRSHDPYPEEEALRGHLEKVLERVDKDGFSYYLPNIKELTLVAVDL